MQKRSRSSQRHTASFFADTWENDLIAQLDLRLLVGGYSPENAELETFHPFRADPFFRIYYPTTGELDVVDVEGRRTLGAGQLCIIPAGQPFRYVYRSHFSHYFLHFSSTTLEKTAYFQQPHAIKAPAGTKQRMRTFVQLAGEKPGIETTLQADILVRQLLRPFLAKVSKTDGYQAREQKHWQPVLEYIQKHLAEKISIPTLASLVWMNRNVFTAEFHKAFGLPPKQYVCQCRIERAKRQLLCTESSVKEISHAVGYDNEFFFSRLFKQYTGSSPSAFRQNSHLGI